MKKKLKNFYLLFILFILLIFTFLLIYKQQTNIEQFVPKKIKEYYRPIDRKLRNKYREFYDNSSKKILNLLKKNGII